VIIYKVKLSNLKFIKRKGREDPFLSIKDKFKRDLRVNNKKTTWVFIYKHSQN
jgi:hypothetical protein